MPVRESWFKRIIAALLPMILLFVYPTFSNAERPVKNIVILNSYHQGLFWTDDEMQGIIDTLKEADINYNISVEYMDWKRYSTYENLVQIRRYLEFKYSAKKTDLVITTDEMALEFTLKNRMGLFSDAPVIFCGVNDSEADRLLKNEERVTGVVEVINPRLTVEAALKINPGLKKIYLVYDITDSGQSTGTMLNNAIKGINRSIETVLLDNRTTEEILDEVSHAPRDSIVISTNYLKDIDGKMVEYEYFCKMLSQRSSVPVYQLYEEAIGKGAFGGAMINGRLQGEGAARIALRVLQGEDIAKIPPDRSVESRLLFDYYQLKRFNISFDSLPYGSQIVNRPESLLAEHRDFITSIIIVVILLLAFIIALLFYLNRINWMKKDLKQQYNDLASTQMSLVASEHKYAQLFEKMLNGFFITEPVLDSDGKIADIKFKQANPEFYRQLRRKGVDVVGKSWVEILGYPCRELHIIQRLLETGGTERFEAHYPNQNTYYAGNAFLIDENEIGVIFDNITDYKTAIKEVKQLNASLEQRVRERTKELQMTLNELEAFTYTVSHDLKSPLWAIDGYSRIILEDSGPRLDADTFEMLGNISKISKEMIGMISKLLQYSTMARTEISREKVDFREKLLSVFDELRVAYPEREISLVIETALPNIFIDGILFRQLLQNVLSNAIKFTRDREEAIITVGCTLTQDQYIFYVKDNGTGFDMEYSGKLFGIFQRLHTSEEFEGSGIGLVTVRKIIEKHGGSVWIEGKVGKGATIYFTLPFSTDEAS